MAANETEEVRLDFENLPLVEAVVRASFASRTQLTFNIINDIARSLRVEFPQFDVPPHIEVAPGVNRSGEPPFIPGHMVGAIYTGNKDGLQITVQDQVIVARWLQGLNPKIPQYPRYAALRDALWKAVTAFRETCGRGTPAIVVVNMSYVNFVKIAHASPILQRYFSRGAQIGLASDAQEVQKLEIAWREQDATDLRLNLQAVFFQVEGETIEGYHLETSGGRRLADGDNEVDVLDRVHGRMQVFFRDLLSDDAKEEWRLREVARG